MHIDTISPIVTDLAESTPEAEYARRVVTAACYRNALRCTAHVIGVYSHASTSQMDKLVTETRTDAQYAGLQIGKKADEVHTDINRQAELLLHKMLMLSLV